MLTEEEKEIILSEVDLRNGSTLGLGALTEGAEVPRRAEVPEFSATVVQKVPKVKGYKYLAAENRVAIVEPQGRKSRSSSSNVDRLTRSLVAFGGAGLSGPSRFGRRRCCEKRGLICSGVTAVAGIRTRGPLFDFMRGT